MSHLSIWIKPGCATNARQLRQLQASGHSVAVHDLLSERWSRAGLAEFLETLPVVKWFNPAAPAIKSGQIVPESLDAEAALTRMLADPLLIRRPLLAVGTARRAGFDADWLAAQGVALVGDAIAEGCAHGESRQPRCATPEGAPR